MTARTDIINEALTHLAQPLVVGVDDSASLVVKMTTLYPNRAKLFLESYPWNFAGKVQQLSASEPTPDDWDYGFNLPAACRKILRVGDQANMQGRREIDHVVRGGRVLTDSDTVWLHYVDGSFADLEGSWPQHPQSALAWDLAELLGPGLDLSQSKLDRITIKAARAMTKAQLWDAQQNPPEPQPLSRWQANHLGGYQDRKNAR